MSKVAFPFYHVRYCAIVEGWDPALPLSTQTKADILDALHKHQVLVLRGHAKPTDAQLVSFAQAFGNLVKGSEWFGDIDQMQPTTIVPTPF